MKKHFLTKTLTLLVALALFTALFAACVPDTNPEVNTPYAIPENLSVNVEIFEGAALLGTISNDTLDNLTQEVVTLTTTNSNDVQTTVSYVAYAISDILEELNITLPAAITSVKTLATDNYDTSFTMTSFENSYLSIGFEEEDAFVEDTKTKNDKLIIQAPRFISDKTSASSNSVTKMVSKIVINPVQAYAIPEDLTADVEIYDGETLLGTVTNEILEDVFQQIVTMTTVNNEVDTIKNYVSYSMNDIFAALEITLPETITSVQVTAADDYSKVYDITSFAASYLTIGLEEDGEFVDDTKLESDELKIQAPRFISDKTSASSGSVAKKTAKIVINPAD